LLVSKTIEILTQFKKHGTAGLGVIPKGSYSLAKKEVPEIGLVILLRKKQQSE
jgi:hypothetical protein